MPALFARMCREPALVQEEEMEQREDEEKRKDDEGRGGGRGKRDRDTISCNLHSDSDIQSSTARLTCFEGCTSWMNNVDAFLMSVGVSFCGPFLLVLTFLFFFSLSHSGLTLVLSHQLMATGDGRREWFLQMRAGVAG